VAGSNPAVPASRHRGLALATMPQDRLHAILCGEYVQLRHKVAEMNRTCHAREIGLIKLAGGFGDLRIMMDREYSRYSMSARQFCGAFISHPVHLDGEQPP
jgi:hypothetical protein